MKYDHDEIVEKATTLYFVWLTKLLLISKMSAQLLSFSDHSNLERILSLNWAKH